MIQGTSSAELGVRGSSAAAATRPSTGGKRPSLRPRVPSRSRSPSPLPQMDLSTSPSPIVDRFLDVPNRVKNLDFLVRAARTIESESLRGSKRSRSSADDPPADVSKASRFDDDDDVKSGPAVTSLESNPWQWPVPIDLKGDKRADHDCVRSLSGLLYDSDILLDLVSSTIGTPVHTGFYKGPGNVLFRIVHQVAFDSADCPLNEVSPLARASFFNPDRTDAELKLNRVLIHWELLRNLSMQHVQQQTRQVVTGLCRAMGEALECLSPVHFVPDAAGQVDISARVADTAARMCASASVYALLTSIPMCLSVHDTKGEREWLVPLAHVSDFADAVDAYENARLRAIAHPLSQHVLYQGLTALAGRVSSTVYACGQHLNDIKGGDQAGSRTAAVQSIEQAKKALRYFSSFLAAAWYAPHDIYANATSCCNAAIASRKHIETCVDALKTADAKIDMLYKTKLGLLVRRMSIGLQAMTMSCAALLFLCAMPRPGEVPVAPAVARAVRRVQTEAVDDDAATVSDDSDATASDDDSDMEVESQVFEFPKDVRAAPASAAAAAAAEPAPIDYVGMIEEYERARAARAAPPAPAEKQASSAAAATAVKATVSYKKPPSNGMHAWRNNPRFELYNAPAQTPRIGPVIRRLENWTLDHMKWHHQKKHLREEVHVAEEIANNDSLTAEDRAIESEWVRKTNAALRAFHGKPTMHAYYDVDEIVDACLCHGHLMLRVKWMTPAGIPDLEAGVKFPYQTWSNAFVVLRNAANDKKFEDFINSLYKH